MKPNALLALAFLLLGAPRAMALPVLELHSEYVPSPEPLTTEKVWELDPGEANPHRQRWALSRKVDLKGLRTVPLKSGGYGVRAVAVESLSQSYVRGPGPWYRPFEEFRCEPEPLSWFSTEEGTRKAAEAAAKSWDETLSSEKVRLNVMLERIHADVPELALEKGKLLFALWLEEVESEWRVSGRQAARMAEWRYYRQQAAAVGRCKPGSPRGKSAPAPSWESMMEPVEGGASEKLAARAPARRWNGLFSVRVDVQVGTKKLNGQFLVDSGAGISVISPDWLEGQGILPAWVEVPSERPQRFVWSGGSGLARKATVDGVAVAGQPAPIRDFLLFDTGFFDVPENIAPCCDGILGTDFMKYFAVEFRPGPPAEVLLYDRAGFQLGPAVPWVETATDPRGEMMSSCAVSPEEERGAHRFEIFGLRWDTGSEAALDIHKAWKDAARAHRGPWDIRCGELAVASAIKPTYPVNAAFESRVPGATAGIPLLARAPFTIDLSHGRLWFSKDGLTARISKNLSGLAVKYVLRGDERVLIASAIRKRTPAAALLRAGLRPGMRISEIDSHSAEDLDQWEVEQRLSGREGDTVTIGWGKKRVAIHLRKTPLGTQGRTRE